MRFALFREADGISDKCTERRQHLDLYGTRDREHP